jgi:hypothetical protein
MTSRRRALWLALVIGCATPQPPSDSATIPTDAPACAAPDPFPIGDATGHATPLGATTGQVRAGRILGSQLPADPAGLATWRDGDYVLANDHLAFVIAQPGNYEIYDPYGGRIRGISQVSSGALVHPADFNVALLGASRFVVATDSVSVLNDGSDGNAAIVRVRGPLAGIDALGPLLAMLIRADMSGWQAALDYVLAPNDDGIEVQLHVRRGDGRALMVPMAMAAFFQSFRMPSWTEVNGFTPLTSGMPRFVAFEDADSTSYAWVALDGGAVQPFYSTGGFDFYTSPGAVVNGCSEHTFRLGRIVVGDGSGLNGVQRVVWRELGDTTRHVTGTLTSSDPLAIAGARVHVTDASMHHLTRTLVDATGTFDLTVPMSAANVYVWRQGAPLEGPFAIPASGPMTIPLASLSTITVDVSDASTTHTLPARVGLFPVGTAPPTVPSDSFGEVDIGNGRSRMEFAPVSGHVEMRVAPGTYRLVVSHGWQYELHDQTFTIAAGETRAISSPLTRSFSVPGVMCADYHIHTHRSVDSEDTGTLKVSALAADALDIAIRSDHEWVDDFAPVVHELGLDDFVVGLAGEELTTFTYGHFGVFPLVVDPMRPSGSAVPWFNQFAPQVFTAVRTRPEAPLLIINHPRAHGIRQGYFVETGYSATTGMVTHPENWDTEFDVVEVVNSSSFDHNRGASSSTNTVEDWYSLLHAGRHVMMVGSSDSHHTHGDPVGYPRTCLYIGTNDVHAVTGNMVRDVTRSGASFVMGGIYLDVTGPNATRPGGTASGVGTRTQLHVTVTAPSFIAVDSLEVIVDGTTTETMPITTDPSMPVRFDGMIDVDVAAAGSWVIVHASSTTVPNIAYGDTPFAVSNPIWLTR